MVIYTDNEGMIKDCVSRVRSDRDLVIALTGPEGEGKSTLAIELARAICEKVGLTFDMERMILFQPNSEQMADAVKNLPRYAPIIADEAIRILYKKKQFDKLQIYLNTLFALARQENKIVILCIPRYTDLNEYFRNHRVYMRIHVLHRGMACVLLKDESMFAKDPWHFDESARFAERKSHGRPFFTWSDDLIESIYSKCGNFLCFMKFDDLDKETQELYKALKKKYAYLDLEIDNGADDRWKTAFGKCAWLLIEHFKCTSLNKIAFAVGIDRRTIREMYMIITAKPEVERLPLLLSDRRRIKKTDGKSNVATNRD